MGIVEETEAKLAALRLRLPELEGKANKKERTQANKEIYALENDDAYVAAVKGRLEGGRAESAAADDADHEARRKAEAAADDQRMQEAEARAKALAESGGAEAQQEDDGESHLEVNKVLLKGDGSTTPARGDSVWCVYTGRFAEGTTSPSGADLSGKTFDTTYDAKKKLHRPLNFQHFGGKAIRGWDEALKGMSLGEKLEVTIAPKWAYRKGGVPDDKGGYVVPPNASLVFEMQLVGVREAKLKDEAAKHIFWGK